jgi:hypothetical protein
MLMKEDTEGNEGIVLLAGWLRECVNGRVFGWSKDGRTTYSIINEPLPYLPPSTNSPKG